MHAIRRWLIRGVLRHLALDALSIGQSAARVLGNPPRPSVVQFVLLHWVKPHQRSRFEKFLDWLAAEYTIVSYATAIDLVAQGNASGRYAAISFDDGLKNNLIAAELLKQRGISACFFVCPHIVGETNPARIATYCQERMLFRSPETFMDWNDLEQLKSEGHEIGNHSQNHFYMRELAEEVFDQEVASARDCLVQRLGDVKHFAWPYGRFFHFREERVGRVLSLGHVSCASGERGAHRLEAKEAPTASPVFCVRRDSIDLQWPLRHIQYFLTRSSQSPVPIEQAWPSL